MNRDNTDARARICAWVLLLAQVGAQADVVYDNTQTYTGESLAAKDLLGRPTEFGDEIRLAGTARIVTKFDFEYYGDFTAQGDETARIRFYRNDGPGRYLTPGTLLWDSEPFAVSPGFNSKALFLPGVEVPNAFTWSVEFAGLAQSPGDQGLMLIYHPPQVGGVLADGRIGSYSDYWVRGTRVIGNWDLSLVRGEGGGTIPANFGARVTAVEEAVHLTPVVQGGQVTLNLKAKANTSYSFQYSDDLLTWVRLGQGKTDAAGALDFVDAAAGQVPRSFYRAVRLILPPPAPMLSLVHRPWPATPLVRVQGSPHAAFQVQVSQNLTTWSYLGTATANAAGAAELEDPAGPTAGPRFYRAWTPW